MLSSAATPPARPVRETWSRRLTVTAFVAAGALARLARTEHRAMVEPDPYGDAYAPTVAAPQRTDVRLRELVGR